MKKPVLAFQFYQLIVYLVSVAVVHSRPPAYRLSPPSSVINMSAVYGMSPPNSAINLPPVYGRSPPRSIKKLHPVYRRSPPSYGIYLLNLNIKYVEVERVGDDGPGVNTSSLDGGGQNRSNGGGVKSWNTSVVVGVSVGGVSAVLFTCWLLGVCLYKLGKRKGASHVKPSSHSTSDADEVTNMRDGYGLMSIQELKNATDNFSPDNILGSGGFGTVYKGELHDGTKVAVKRMQSGVMSRKVLEQFKSEIAVLTKVGHRHLVKLLGYCLDGIEGLLVYEYMPQGTLARFLFDWKQEGLKPLEWTQRLTIGLDVARGIEYLHGLANHSYIHRDLKPSNILLADDMRAKVADFGLVRPAPRGEYSFVSRLAGTFGYIAPEYAGSGQVNKKVDVYSFGVILMVLITGRRALNATQEKESVTLVQWFLRMHKDKATSQRAIDPILELDEEALAVVSTVAELAVHCCASEPHRRPNMNHVVRVLSSIAEPWKPSESESESESGSDSSDSCKINIDEEALPSVVEPAVHNCAFEPQQSPDKSLAVGVISNPSEHETLARRVIPLGWKPSEHSPDDNSDTDDTQETEIDEETPNPGSRLNLSLLTDFFLMLMKKLYSTV